MSMSHFFWKNKSFSYNKKILLVKFFKKILKLLRKPLTQWCFWELSRKQKSQKLITRNLISICMLLLVIFYIFICFDILYILNLRLHIVYVCSWQIYRFCVIQCDSNIWEKIKTNNKLFYNNHFSTILYYKYDIFFTSFLITITIVVILQYMTHKQYICLVYTTYTFGVIRHMAESEKCW